MRDSFSGFYGVSETTIGEVFKANNTVFIFDTNILLTLYRCEEETRNQFIEIWRKVKEQCWFPHHVCLEYQRNRLTVIKSSRDSLNAIPERIKKVINELRNDFEGQNFNQTISRYSKLRNEIDALLERFGATALDFENQSIKTRNSNIDFFHSHDVIRDEIDQLTAGRIGPPPLNQEIINNLNRAGKERYKYKVGPGYEDSANKSKVFFSFNNINYDSEYGDYYVWSQILDFVQSSPDKNIVYVTNDSKADFFFKIDRKIRGPNESLTSEIKKAGAKEFLLHNIDGFLHHANIHLNAKLNEETITELTNAGTLTKRKRKSAIEKSINAETNIYSFSTKEIESLTDDELSSIYDELNAKLDNSKSELSRLGTLVEPNFEGAAKKDFERIKDTWLRHVNHLTYTIRRLERVASNRASRNGNSLPLFFGDDIEDDFDIENDN